MRGEFAKQNHQFKQLWEKWGTTVKVATAAVIVLFVYASLRNSFSLSLAERADEVLKSQAKSVANLKGKAATESGIRKYIRDNKKRAADLKTLANVAQMNSAMDIVKKINDATPGKSSLTLDVHQLDVADNQVTMQGYVNSAQEVTTLQKSLMNITTNGQVQSRRSSLATQAGRTAFSFSFAVDRGVQKVTR
jgi:general secretion pathway protein L